MFCNNRALHSPLPHLIYNSKSKPDSDNEMDLGLPWREVQDIPSFWFINIMRNPPQQPTENNSPFSLQNDTPSLNITDNHDRDGLCGDGISGVPPCGLDL